VVFGNSLPTSEPAAPVVAAVPDATDVVPDAVEVVPTERYWRGGAFLVASILLNTFRRRLARRLQPAFRNSKNITSLGLTGAAVWLIPFALYQLWSVRDN
jgi:hypothetical protein